MFRFNSIYFKAVTEQNRTEQNRTEQNVRISLNRILKNSVLFLLGFLLFPFNEMNAQTTTLFTYVDSSTINFTPAELVKLQTWQANPLNKEVYYVNIADISVVEVDGSILFSLPDTTLSIYATTNGVIYNDVDDFTWSGNINGNLGSLMLIQDSIYTYGYINFMSNTYSLKTLGNHHVLILHTNLPLPNDGCGNDSLSVDNGPPTNPRVGCASTVLVVYTAKAKQAGNPKQDADMFVKITSQALQNSQTSHEVVLVGVEPINYIETSNDIKGDIDKLATSFQIQTLRDQVRADIAFILTDGNYSNAYGVVRATLGGSSLAYVLVEIDGPSITLAHEFGHILGCYHDSPLHANNYAYGAQFGVSRTLLNVTDINDIRRLHYSNPDVTFQGAPTGVSNVRDNARQIDDWGCFVASYRNGPDLCTGRFVDITGPQKGTNSGTYNFCAITADCPEGTITYSWEYSINGFNWYSFGTTMCITAQLPQDKDLHLRVVVNCSDGCQIKGGHFVINMSGAEPFTAISDYSENMNYPNKILIYPNPTSDVLNVINTIHGNSLLGVKFNISNISGRIFKKGKFDHIDKPSIKVSTIPNGEYIITIHLKDKIVHETFIIQH